MNGKFGTARNRQSILGLAFALLVLPLLAAQTDNDMSHFEVVSVRLNTKNPNEYGSDFGKCSGGPGTQDPTLWMCHRINTIYLLRSTFALEVYQWTPPGSWSNAYLSVSARLPAKATKDQFREMLRNMLEERFGLTWHWKESDATVYRLVRDAGGVKLHESAPDAEPAL